jgi:hypothetical protein
MPSDICNMILIEIIDPLTPPFPSPSLFDPLPTDPNTGYPETKACLEVNTN